MDPAPTSSPTPSEAPSVAGSVDSRSSKRISRWPDRIFYGIFLLAGLVVIALAFALLAVLVYNSRETIGQFGWNYLFGTVWSPNAGVYGVVPMVLDTLITSVLALLLAIPLALGCSIFLTTHAPRLLRRPIGTAVELLAAIPSVIYGLWGLYVLHPYMAKVVEPKLQVYLGFTGLFDGTPIGLDLLTAGVVLTIMILPTITAVSRDAMNAVPAAQREAALSLGATSWETTRTAVLPYARSGIVGGTILGLGRALGETMAVLLVIGGSVRMPTSLLSQGSTISTLIASELTSNSGPQEYSAVLEAGIVLLVIALLVNVFARLLVARVLKSSGRTVE